MGLNCIMKNRHETILGMWLMFTEFVNGLLRSVHAHIHEVHKTGGRSRDVAQMDYFLNYDHGADFRI